MKKTLLLGLACLAFAFTAQAFPADMPDGDSISGYTVQKHDLASTESNLLVAQAQAAHDATLESHPMLQVVAVIVACQDCRTGYIDPLAPKPQHRRLQV